VASVIFLAVALALLVGFAVLTGYETRTGTRFFAERRARFDRDIERLEFIAAHVDFAAFARDEARHAADSVGHSAAQLSLQAVRAVERTLTRVARSLRARHEMSAVPRESTREFVKTLSEFKDTLEAEHPEVPDRG
jgi:hypothetical protein